MYMLLNSRFICQSIHCSHSNDPAKLYSLLLNGACVGLCLSLSIPVNNHRFCTVMLKNAKVIGGKADVTKDDNIDSPVVFNNRLYKCLICIKGMRDMKLTKT